MNGKTALIVAASTSQSENKPMVKALIDAGANVNIAENCGAYCFERKLVSQEISSA